MGETSGVNKTGVLVVNLGTPKSYEPQDVGEFLKEFLMDPEVITAPSFVRWPLVNLLIVPKRKYDSGANYKKIWMHDIDKSPLLHHSEQFVDKLAKELNVPVSLGMRYQQPSLQSAMQSLKDQGCNKAVVFPLFPQFSTATTRTAFDKLDEVSSQIKYDYLCSYSSNSQYIDAQADLIRSSTKDKNIEHHLLSFHGLPESILRKEDPSKAHCLKVPDCCAKSCAGKSEALKPVFDSCYRAQCYDTAQALSKALGWSEVQWTMTFQSRLGPTKWTTPYTSETLKKLAVSGVKSVSIACPAFPTDCLETLEEIGMGLKEEFLESGGEEFTLVPCLNSEPVWIKSAAEIVRQRLASTS